MKKAPHTLLENTGVLQAREDFPILQTQAHGKPLIYFDNAATSQKPFQVIERLTKYYTSQNANIHRGVYYLSDIASAAYENARSYMADSLHAASPSEVIFVRGATEGINLVSSSWGGSYLNEGDEVIVSGMEHHSNLVPWQRLCAQKNAQLRIIPVNENGTLDLEEYKNLFNKRTKLIACVWASNSIGTINPIKEIISIAHGHEVPILVDACQAAPHLPIDVRELDCDFLVFSGHKTFGPTGIGVLYAKMKHLEAMPPYQSGGDMIDTVTYRSATYAPPPQKFEAGTPHIAGAIGLAEAFKYIAAIGREGIHSYEQQELLPLLTEGLQSIRGIRIIGTAAEKIPVVSFTVKGAHPLDIGTLLDFEGVAIRTGNHCTQPLLAHLGVNATCRASLAFYNTPREIENFISALQRVLFKLSV